MKNETNLSSRSGASWYHLRGMCMTLKPSGKVDWLGLRKRKCRDVSTLVLCKAFLMHRRSIEIWNNKWWYRKRLPAKPMITAVLTSRAK